jgi:hypothetical protein
LLGLQLIPIVHATHVPPPHTMFVPQEVPSGWLPVAPHTIVPVVHTFAPVLHGFVGWQPVPAVQAAQVPLLHTMLTPHDVPFGLLPDSAHVDMPVVHVVTPFLQGFVGGQLVPGVQPEHAPLLQTWLVPHDVPFALLPVSAHTIVPVAHEFVPVLHVLPGWQLVPAVQAAHVPLLQTWLVPHDVPFALLPVSAHTDAPVTHDVVPVRHMFVGWQLAADVHATHAPLLQTRLVPQTDPLTRLVPLSAQVMVGAQDVKPA